MDLQQRESAREPDQLPAAEAEEWGTKARVALIRMTELSWAEQSEAEFRPALEAAKVLELLVERSGRVRRASMPVPRSREPLSGRLQAREKKRAAL